MFKQFYPKVNYRSVYEIDFAKYFQAGYRAVLFDIDNTLVEHEAPYNKRSADLISELKNIGFSVCIISNNHEPRVKSFACGVGTEYIFDAGKPSVKGYVKAMKMIGSTPETTLMVGDQLFTDIWGANRSGIYSVLVKQINSDPYFHIKMKRIGEAVVKLFFFMYFKKNPEEKFLK